MTTFEEFVATVYTQLPKQYPNSDISLQKIHSILSQIDIAKALQQETLQAFPIKLQVRRLRISGHKRKIHAKSNNTAFVYDRHLEQGINGWIAGNDAGKSTILKAIVWGITGVEQSFKQDIHSWIEDVALEITIGDTIYTIRYFPRVEQPRVNGYIVQESLDTVLQKGDISPISAFIGSSQMIEKIDSFFTERLPLSSFQQEQSEALLYKDSQKKITWQIYSQALFIGSNYTDYLFPRNIAGKLHQNTLSAYLGYSSTDSFVELEVARNKTHDNYKFEERRVMVDAQEGKEKIKELQAELQLIDVRIKAIDEGQSVLVDPAYITIVQEHIAQHTSQIVDLSMLQQQIIKEERGIQNKIDDMQRACQELQEAIQFKVFLSGLSIERCPHCEQELAAGRIEEEMQKKQCRLCYNELRPVQSVEHYEIMLQEKQQIIKELKDNLRNIRGNIRKNVNICRKEEEELAHWRNELQDLPRQERAGFTQEMRSIIDKRGYISGQLQQLQEQTEEVHSENLKQLKDIHEVLEIAYTEMQAFIWRRYSKHWNLLEARITELAKRFGIADLESVSFQLGQHFDLSIKQGDKFMHFRDMEASEMLRLKLAIHLAMLMVSISDGMGRHPGLLIIDAPGGAEMDEQHFQQILQGFSDIHKQIGTEIQLLIASTKESMTSICRPDCLEHLRDKEVLF